MKPTPDGDVRALLDELLTEIRARLGTKLVGLYVFGSLATGAFEPATSDIDLVAALTTDLDEEEFRRIEAMHAAIARRFPRWADRVEVGYVAVAKLRRIAPDDTIALISPGEPFHGKEAGNDWLFNLVVLREHGLVLAGPPPATLIDPIPREELVARLRPLMREWRAWITETHLIHQRAYQAHMIITMCRNLYLAAHGEVATKHQAVAWAELALPAWAALIREALVWRAAGNDAPADGSATLAAALRFVHFTIYTLLDESTPST